MMMNARGPKPLNFMSYCTVSLRPSASVTSMAIGKLPVYIGFPDKIPVERFNVRPLSAIPVPVHV